MRNYAGTCKDICSYNLVYNFLIQLLPLKSSVFVVHFSNAFWHGNEAFPKVSSQNEIVPFLVIFHLPHSKYRGAKICFYCAVIKIKIFHSCGTRVMCRVVYFFRWLAHKSLLSRFSVLISSTMWSSNLFSASSCFQGFSWSRFSRVQVFQGPGF